ncbi:Alpha/Beta hydrolase protein [Aspergillus undulatus]|uniref:Alpha/Beta hydrolase protein n=1 Tax=Aspergillus undulatus TaxID=1810928 RepID=UPI003CCDF704
MPSSKARSSSSVDRRDRLTLAKLASYDDVATDALVDCAYFWTKTRKNRTKYIPVRGLVEDTVARILLHDVIVAKDTVAAERKILELKGMKRYLGSLPSDREKDWFRKHLRKYIHMYLSDCPFEVTTTNRYTITEHEAAICARRFVPQGQEIKYLAGTLVPMTKEEEQDLDLKRKDFSIVMSSRRKTPSFFLGPARFANHDCNANGRLVTRGSEGMQVVATRDIYIGEEITVSYGDDYFGIDNCECLCLTCERLVRNGWSPNLESEPQSKATTPEIGAAEDFLTPRKRKAPLDADSDTSPSSTPRKRGKFTPRSSKLRSQLSLTEEVAISIESTPNLLPVPDSAQIKGDSTASNGQSPSGTDSESLTSNTPEESQTSSASTAATSICDESTTRKTSTEAPLRGLTTTVAAVLDSESRADSCVSDISSSVKLEDPSDLEHVMKPKRTKTKRVYLTVEPESKLARVPGDYTKTPKLLAHSYDRWVDCHTCNAWFVQENSYLTRRECPRCERHSMLYGFRWPKTEKEGPHDDEERVMDHREIHRFLYPEEEALISRKGRGVSFGITPTPELSDMRSETPDRRASASQSNYNKNYTTPHISLPYISLAGNYSPEYNITYFRKIPYAAPPTGENRFRAPQPPHTLNHYGIYNTDQPFDMCPQRTVNGSEDCLYLGLFSRPWDWQDRDLEVKRLRPVLVVFHGGAFIQGEASFDLPPSSFPVLNVSNLNDYIVIYPSYRLNAFGFLSGRVINEAPDADLNAGLLDQEYVLQWVQSYIHYFGGDKGNVTIWGQSAGGGSVIAQVLANGRNGRPKLFQKALASSPFWPRTYKYDDPEAEDIYSRFVELTGCNNNNTNYNDGDTLSCLKKVDVQTIRDASLVISGSHTYTTSSYTWAPVIDGTFLTRSLTDAVKSRGVDIETEYIFSVYNTHEGENFIPPGFNYPASNTNTSDGFNSSTESFRSWLAGFLPGLSAHEIDLLETKYYPEYGTTETLDSYNSTFVRAGLIYRDLVLACPAYWLALAARERGYLAEYTISPARHASDTIYWNTINPIQQTDSFTYKGFAGAFGSFFQTGDPNAHKLTGNEAVGVPELKKGNEKEWVISGGEEGFGHVRLGELKGRCEFFERVGGRVPV